MTNIVSLDVPPNLWADLCGDLLSTPHLERAAVGFAGVVERGSTARLLLRDWVPVPAEEYLAQLSYHLEVSPVFWARAAKRARVSKEAVVIIHSHPGDRGVPAFSGSDDAGEAVLVPKLQARSPVPVVAAVIGPGGCTVRFSGDRGGLKMVLRTIGEPPRRSTQIKFRPALERQVRALGKDGQSLINGLTIGVVGAGGLGSHVIQQLVHLGVGSVVIIDPDRVADTNLSRLVGASRLDALVHRHKTGIGRRLARRLGGNTVVTAVRRSVVSRAGALQIAGCDFVIGCTDNHLSRLVLNTLAFQYYIPVMDLGVELQRAGAMGGRVAWLSPGSACLWCMDVLDPERVRVEQLPRATRTEEVARGYIEGLDEPAPAVVSINGVVASLAVTELLARITGFAGSSPRSSLLLYRLGDGVVRRASPAPRAECPTCSSSGVLGSGDLSMPPWIA